MTKENPEVSSQWMLSFAWGAAQDMLINQPLKLLIGGTVMVILGTLVLGEEIVDDPTLNSRRDFWDRIMKWKLQEDIEEDQQQEEASAEVLRMKAKRALKRQSISDQIMARRTSQHRKDRTTLQSPLRKVKGVQAQLSSQSGRARAVPPQHVQLEMTAVRRDERGSADMHTDGEYAFSVSELSHSELSGGSSDSSDSDDCVQDDDVHVDMGHRTKNMLHHASTPDDGLDDDSNGHEFTGTDISDNDSDVWSSD
jgi:hypothetical protein